MSAAARKAAAAQIAASTVIENVTKIDDEKLRNVAAQFNVLINYCRRKSSNRTKPVSVSSSSSSVQLQIAAADLVVVDGLDETDKFWPIVVAFNEIVMHYRCMSKLPAKLKSPAVAGTI